MRYRDHHDAKKRDCLERERNFGIIYEQAKHGILRMSRTGAQFCSNRGATSSVRDPRLLERQSQLFFGPKINIERRFFEDAPSESAILKRTRARPKYLRDGRARRHGGRRYI